MDFGDIDADQQKIAVLLGNSTFGVRSIESTLKTHRYFFFHKYLASSVRNWRSIVRLLTENSQHLRLVQAQLTEYVVFLLTLPQYSAVAHELLQLMKKVPHQMFIFDDNLYGRFSCASDKPKEYTRRGRRYSIGGRDENTSASSDLDWWCSCNDFPGGPVAAVESMVGTVKSLVNDGYNVVPYKKIIDIDTSGSTFVEHVVSGLVLRVYVPNKRLWSQELDRMITLFRDYVSQMSRVPVQLSQSRTGSGVTFSLYAPESGLSPDDIRAQFDQFASFLDICNHDPTEARKVLATASITGDEATGIVSRYAKEARRLVLDLKHERETRLLAIRHSLESELSEIQIENAAFSAAARLLPEPTTPSSALALPRQDASVRSIMSALVVNINPQIINNVEGIVAQHLEGTINYTAHDKELIRLIEKYADTQGEIAELRSALEELRDPEVAKEAKTSAWQRCGRFLSKIGGRIGDVGVSLLKTYLEELLKRGM